MTTNKKLQIVVGSRNPVKLKATEEAFTRVFPNFEIAVEGVSVPSGVAEQPMSDYETKAGAVARVRAVQDLRPDAHFWVGLEGGLETIDHQLWCMAWAVVMSAERKGEARAAAFPLPQELKVLIEQGNELGAADDLLFGRVNSKQQDGTVGILTRGAITRLEYYVHPLVMALIPVINSELSFAA